MHPLLLNPTCVLYVTADGVIDDDVRETILEGTATEIHVVSTIEKTVDLLDDRSDIGCIVLATEDTEVMVTEDSEVMATEDSELPLPEACDTLRSAEELVPIIVYEVFGSPERASRATVAGATSYVTGTLSDDVLRTAVDRAIEAYDTARTRAEESDMFSTILEAFESSIYVKDDEGRHLRKSRTMRDLSPEVFVGKTDTEVYGEGERDSYEEDLEVINDGVTIEGHERQFEGPDGIRWARTTKVPWRDQSGQIKGLVGNTRDVTEIVRRRKRLERQDQRLDQVTSYFMHDLTTPLQLALGYLEVAQETGDLSALEDVKSALRRMDNMVDDLASIATGVDDASLPVGSEEPLAGTHIEDLVWDVWSVVSTAESTLENEFTGSSIVHAPASSLRLVLENLFKNAIDHGGSAVTVRIGSLETGGIFVEDDGPGISSELRKSVREHGFTTSDGGSGIGLSIVEDVIDQHDWDLAVRDGRDGGTRIEIHNALVVDNPNAIVDVQTAKTKTEVEKTEATTEDEKTEAKTEIDNAEAKTDIKPAATISAVDPAQQLTETADVGSLEISGQTTYDPETDQWQCSGGGRRIYNETNQFHFGYATVSEPFRLEGRIREIEAVSEWSLAGLMVRSGLEEDAAYGYIGRSAEYGTGVRWRTRPSMAGTYQQFEINTTKRPWYRIDCLDETITTFVSTDGTQWFPVDQRQVNADTQRQVGLVVCSNIRRHRCRATFEDVSLFARTE